MPLGTCGSARGWGRGRASGRVTASQAGLARHELFSLFHRRCLHHTPHCLTDPPTMSAVPAKEVGEFAIKPENGGAQVDYSKWP